MAEQDRRNERGKQPISRHPLFLVTVALWCGALFGLGSLAATASLGTTARIALAVVMAGIGALLGARLARRIANPERTAGEAVDEVKVAEASADKPVLSSAEGANERPGSHRRTLIPDKLEVMPDNPRRMPTDSAPQILDVADVDFEGFASVSKQVIENSYGKEAAPRDIAEPAPPHRTVEELPPTEPVAESSENRPLDAAPVEPNVERQADPSPPAAMNPAAQRIASADLDELSHVELLERLALSMQRRSEEMAKAKDAEGNQQPVERKNDRRSNEPSVAFPGRAERSRARFGRPSTGLPEDKSASSAEQPDTEAGENSLRDALSALQRISSTR